MFGAFDVRAIPEEAIKYMCLFSTLTHSDLLLSLQWRRNGRDSVSNHQPHDCFLNRSIRRRSKKTSNAGNSLGTGEFPAQMANKAENVSILWRHHDLIGQRSPVVIDRSFGWLDHLPQLVCLMYCNEHIKNPNFFKMIDNWMTFSCGWLSMHFTQQSIHHQYFEVWWLFYASVKRARIGLLMTCSLFRST